jgi:hypothetical protein
LSISQFCLRAEPKLTADFYNLFSTRSASLEAKAGGEGGIRTPVGREAKAVFKTAAIDHSATSPQFLAGREGLEPSTNGFGDRYSTN